MKIQKRNMQIDNVGFEVTDETFADGRFAKIKVWVAHTGKNRNDSIFSRDTLVSMSNTLKYVPIVGYVEKNSKNKIDFGGHEIQITLEKDGVKMDYLGQPYGFIPENPNEKMEFRDGKEWLTCEGYLWTKFTDGIDIMNNNDGLRSHSMEIQDVEGFVDDKGSFNIENATFSGLCILGDDHPPAMEGSTIELFTSKPNFKSEMEEMFRNFSMKGEQELDKEKDELEVVEEVELDAVVAEEEVEATEVSEEVESFEEEAEELDEEEPEEAPEEGEVAEDEPEAEVSEEISTYAALSEKYEQYVLSLEDKRSKLLSELKKNFDNDSQWLYIAETYDDYVIFHVEGFDGEEWSMKTGKCGYSLDGDTVVIDLDAVEEVHATYLTAEEKERIDSDRARIKELENELANYTKFVSEQENAQKESMLAEFEDVLSEESVEELREKMEDFGVEDFEKEVALVYVKQTKATKTEKKKNVTAASFSLFSSVQAEGSEEKAEGFGQLEQFFAK